MEFFQDNCWIWVTWTINIVCVCTTAFKVSIPPLNGFFPMEQSPNNTYQAIALLEKYFPIRERCFINTRNSDFSGVLKICIICFMDFIYLGSLTGLFKFNIRFLDILLVLFGIIPYSRFTGLNNILYIYIHMYIYIYIYIYMYIYICNVLLGTVCDPGFHAFRNRQTE